MMKLLNNLNNWDLTISWTWYWFTPIIIFTSIYFGNKLNLEYPFLLGGLILDIVVIRGLWSLYEGKPFIEIIEKEQNEEN